MLDKLYAVNRALNRRFPAGADPFQIMTRLLEEGGELAEQVNIFEHTGVKPEKHGAPDPDHLAMEVKGVLLCALQIAMFYHVEAELNQSIERSYERLKAEGWLED